MSLKTGYVLLIFMDAFNIIPVNRTIVSAWRAIISIII